MTIEGLGDGQLVLVDQEKLRKLFLHLLDDQHGVSEAAHSTMQMITHDLIDPSRSLARISAVMNKVKASEGRFYLPEGQAESLCRIFGWKDLDITEDSGTV